MAIQPSSSEAGPSTPINSRQANYALGHTLTGHSRAVTALRFSHDGQTLISAGADGHLHFWDSRTAQHKRSIRCHKTGINDISISCDDLYIATASDDNTATIRLFPTAADAETSLASQPLPPLRLLSAHTAPVLAVAFSPKSNLLATGSYDESAIVWDVQRGEVLRTLPAHAEAIWTVGWDREGAIVLTGSADGLIRLWDAHSGQCLKTLDNETNSPVSHVSFTPSSVFLLSATLSSTLRVYNIYTGKVVKTLKAPQFVSEKYPCPATVFAPPEPAQREVHERPLPEDDAMSIDADTTIAGSATRRKEAWVVCGSESGKIIIWELNSRQVVQALEHHDAHTAPVVALAVSPDGRTIATGSLEPDKLVCLWTTGGAGDTT